ncbi:MAG: ABC transporter ATP-binding protein [Bdellovibrionales bacterium]
MSEVLRINNLHRNYVTASGTLAVLRGATFTISAGEMVALVGPSGAGKSTLLHICGLLDAATSGDIYLLNRNVAQLDDGARTELRRDRIGFVYQFHHLLPELNAQENVAMPCLLAGRSMREAMARAADLLGTVGLSGRLSHRPSQLSGGEQQRVAICRALANKPKLLIADEPTGNLDPHTGEAVFALFRQLAQKEGVATLMATHNMALASQASRTLTLADGIIR